MKKYYPCDTEPFDCPFDAQCSGDCRNYCGLGVDEDEPEEYEYEEDELKRYAVSGIFLAYYKQIEDLIEEYYDFLDVSIEDRPYDE